MGTPSGVISDPGGASPEGYKSRSSRLSGRHKWSDQLQLSKVMSSIPAVASTGKNRLLRRRFWFLPDQRREQTFDFCGFAVKNRRQATADPSR
ncbi:hypothetical protein PR002_g23810 [Phytophthora rubi]|uniref:Uncharacterized protein n=1 Tax=Phytophthora rubi TaxID=129364 RepID=A0A6A3ILV4_9STRA|nr:hypothetical protein PR002_g23810 [Phytophthora rubi]